MEKVFTLEDFRTNPNICFDDPNTGGERLEDDEEALYSYVQDMFNEATEEPLSVEKVQYLSDLFSIFKNIPVYEKSVAHFDADVVVDYICDNYYTEGYDELEGFEELEKAIEKFNSIQTHYTNGKKLGYLDCLKEMKEYFEELREKMENDNK